MNDKHNCLNCKKYHLELDEGKSMGYICDAEQKQEDSEYYPGKKYYGFWLFAACNPKDENTCSKFKLKGY